jgi:hypothetical protein
MKKLSMIPVIAVGACAACCALPWLPTLLAGLLASSTGTFLIGWIWRCPWTGLAVWRPHLDADWTPTQQIRCRATMRLRT